ncbi:MAG: DUF4038 domain-containing protein [Verrucomicrobiales bacterium]
MNQYSRHKPYSAILVWAGLALGVLGAEQVLQTETNVMVELTLTASRTYGDPANEVTLDVSFIDPTGRELRVPAFWDGKNIWKVRYASPVLGTHRFRSEFPDAADSGLHGATGKVEIKPYTGGNPLYKHGPLRMAPSRRYLEHSDGTPFFWLGDTWWMGLCHRLEFPDEFKKLASDRKEKGFNVVQIVAGLYPDMPPFDPRGANETGFPWEKDYARIRPEYFDAADQRLAWLVEQGFTPCIVGAWGYFIKFMGVEKAKQHWRNLVARYGAWPVVWCVAGEANLPYYQAKGFPYDDRAQVKGWTDVTRYLREADPFHRLITIHPTGIGRLSARNAIEDISLLDIDMLQTPHGEREAVPPTVRTVRECYADKPVLPVINGEAAYEMLNGKIPAAWPRAMFWVCMMNGAAGHTYGANGIWQCNRRGEPHGPSPTAGSPPTGYGVIPWDEAMNLPGSKQIGLGKKLLAQYRWHEFVPHPEWAALARAASLSFDRCQWIWFPEGKPAQDAPVEKRFFRKAFSLPDGKVIESARLRLSADDKFTARLNGEAVGSGSDWKAGRHFNEVARRLRPGRNVLAVIGENLPAPVPANPAGLLACLEIRFAGGESLNLISDATWRCAESDTTGWDTLAFDDSAWSNALAAGRYGDPPWGRIDQRSDEAFAPHCAGIPGSVRVVYVPESEPIVLRELGAKGAYAATYFDPVTGAKTALPTMQADAAGSWTCPPPAGHNHDWVLILEAKATSGAALQEK